MTELATNRSAEARSRLSRSGEELSSGLRVMRPSDDPAAWASAQRARLRHAASTVRGGAIATSNERIQTTDGALATIGDVVSRARELSVQAANSTLDANGRAAIAQEVRALAATALAAANSTSADGEYVLAGSRGNTAPFDATGAYFGDSLTTEIENSPSSRQIVSVSGDVLLASSGINILGELEAFSLALEANDLAGIQSSVGALDVGVLQIARARSSMGALSASLDLADSARVDLEFHLSELISKMSEVDSIAAASDLAGARVALEVSQAVTELIVNVTRI